MQLLPPHPERHGPIRPKRPPALPKALVYPESVAARWKDRPVAPGDEPALELDEGPQAQPVHRPAGHGSVQHQALERIGVPIRQPPPLLVLPATNVGARLAPDRQDRRRALAHRNRLKGRPPAVRAAQRAPVLLLPKQPVLDAGRIDGRLRRSSPRKHRSHQRDQQRQEKQAGRRNHMWLWIRMHTAVEKKRDGCYNVQH